MKKKNKTKNKTEMKKTKKTSVEKLKKTVKTDMKKKTSAIAIVLVIICTILTSTGQILWKVGAKTINSFDIVALITNVPLMLGFVSYALGAVILISALKKGELSVLYPFIALSFIWVTLISIFLFHEHVLFVNWLGIVSILIGVSLIGYGSSR